MQSNYLLLRLNWEPNDHKETVSFVTFRTILSKQRIWTLFLHMHFARVPFWFLSQFHAAPNWFPSTVRSGHSVATH